ncbi:MAG: glycosyltransferase family 9 protein [Gammaproteobacteria bacterium]
MSFARAERVLAVRLDNLGDVVMTTPALAALKHGGPATRKLTLLASPAGAALAPHLDMVDEVIAHAPAWMPGGGDAGADRALIARLAALRFDAAVIFTSYSQSALPAAQTCHLAGIPLRLAHCRENPYGLLTHWVRESEPEEQARHEVRRQLDLVREAGCAPREEGLSFALRARDRQAARRRLRVAGITSGARPLVVVHAGATAAARRYPAALYARTLDLLAGLAPCDLVLTGSAAERPAVAALAAACACQPTVLAGELDLGALGALLAQADLLVSNNSCPVHIAAALGTPVVDLYALTNPQHTPWRVAHRLLFHDVPCRNCHHSVCPEQHHQCLRGVAPARVALAALELLQPPVRASEAACDTALA